jgi:hypothetical protein
VKLHADDDFVLVGINSYDDPAAVAEGIERFGIEYPVVVQDETAPICRQYRVGAFPTYIVLDREGRIRARPMGATQLDAVVEALLKEPAPEERRPR